MGAAGDRIMVPLIWEQAGKTSGYWCFEGSLAVGDCVEDWSKASMEVEIGVETCIDAYAWHYVTKICIYASRW